MRVGEVQFEFVLFFVLHLDNVAVGGSVAARRLAVVMVISVDGTPISCYAESLPIRTSTDVFAMNCAIAFSNLSRARARCSVTKGH